MLQNKIDNLTYIIAYDLTYRKGDMVDFLRKNNVDLKNGTSDEQVASKLYDFINSSRRNAEAYSAFLAKDDFRYIDPITIGIIVTSLISIGTGSASLAQSGKAGRQQAARLSSQQIGSEQAQYISELESRRAFLTNLFMAQQQIIQEDEKAFRRAQNLKYVSISFLVLTLILGGVWLARKRA